MRNRYVLFFALSLFTLSATAADWPAPIQRLADQGLTIVKRFDAPGGLTGYAARAGQTPVALYLTPDGEHVVVGTLFDAKGHDLSRNALASPADASDTETLWAQLADAHWIADGPSDAPRTVYVFTDPNCPYCHRFFEASRAWVRAGRVQLRHIPVGIMAATSPGQAAAWLTADDPTAAYRQHEKDYAQGGIKPLADIPPAVHEQILANNALMAGLGIHGTPGIIYRDTDGQIAIHQGMPQGKQLTAVLGPHP